MTIKKKIKNSIRAYVMGDALGVPFEFRKEGTFKCDKFDGYMTHNKKPGTWSDDTSILLSLMDALTFSDETLLCVQKYKQNLVHWYYNDEFTVDGLFDAGSQTSDAISSNFSLKDEDRMGNGALFYSLPLACIFLDTQLNSLNIFEKFCRVTHNNKNCFLFGVRFSLVLRDLFLSLPPEKKSLSKYLNQGDVKNTFYLIFEYFQKLKDKPSSLFEDLCSVIDLGKDTDTNAALFGAMIGTIKKVDEKDWKKVQRYEYIDRQINSFLNSLEVNGTLRC